MSKAFLGILFDVFEASWGAFWGSWGTLGGLLEPFGAIVGRLGAKLKPLRVLVGLLGALLGTSWSPLPLPAALEQIGGWLACTPLFHH